MRSIFLIKTLDKKRIFSRNPNAEVHDHCRLGKGEGETGKHGEEMRAASDKNEWFTKLL